MRKFLAGILLGFLSFSAHAEVLQYSPSIGSTTTSGSPVAFSALTSAQGNNNIDNTSFQQTWLWSGVTGGVGLKIQPTALTTGIGFEVLATAGGASGAPVALEGVMRAGTNGANTGYAGYFNNATTGAGYGVYSTLASVAGSNTGYAGYFSNADASGVNYGVYGSTASSSGYAGYFSGAVNISGALTVSSCSGCGGVPTGTTNRLVKYTSTSAVGDSGALSISTTNSRQINFLDNITTGGLIGIPDLGLDNTSIAVGSGALISQTTSALRNAAVGFSALGISTTQGGLVAVGWEALFNQNGSGGVNPVQGVGIGYNVGNNGSGFTSGTGAANQFVVIGGSADIAVNSFRNIAIGYEAAAGSFSIVLGAFSDQHPASSDAQSTHSVIIGYDAGNAATGTLNTTVGDVSSPLLSTGTGNTVLGAGVGGTLTIGSDNIFIGVNNAISATTSSDTNTIKIGGTGGDWVKVTGTNTNTTANTIAHGVWNMPDLTQTSAAQTGTVCSGTAGVFTVDTTLGCLSSLEELKNIQQGGIENALTTVLKLRAFWYTWKENSPQYKGGNHEAQPGFGAHQVESVDKRLVGYGPDGKLRGVKYEQMSPLLAAAIQEQEQKIEQLQKILTDRGIIIPELSPPPSMKDKIESFIGIH